MTVEAHETSKNTRRFKGLKFNALNCFGFKQSHGAAHNLKAAGSNPAPATKKVNTIKDFKAEHNARLYSLQILVNTWSTFYEPPIDEQHDRAERSNHAAALHVGSSHSQISTVISASGCPSSSVPSK